MVAQGPKSIADLFWRSPDTGNLRCNIRFAPVLSTGKKFDGSTFLKFVKKLLERSDKTAIVMDAASQHRTKDLKEFVKENSHRLQIMYLPTGCPELGAIEVLPFCLDGGALQLPTGCPELGAIEECWHQLKIQPFMYERHEHVSGRARAAMKYLRTTAFSQNIE